MKTRILFALALGALLLAACGAAAPAAQPAPDNEPTSSTEPTAPAAPTAPAGDAGLDGTTWNLTSLDGAAVIANSTPTLEFFEPGRVGGKASCNRYTTGYSIDGTTITINQAASTMMACEPAVMEQERIYLDILGRAASFAIAGDTLTITADDGAVLEFARA